MFYKKNRGVTLVEMLIVIIIIGILAALAFPQFSKTKEHAIGKEAIVNLKLIAAAEKIYRMEGDVYYPIPAGEVSGSTAISNINDFLRLSIPKGDTKNWDYAVSSLTNTSTATRFSGSSSGCTYTINFTADEPTNVSCP